MFVRKQTVKGITYLSLVENRWNPAKHKHYQIKIAGLGKQDDPQALEMALKITRSLNLFCQKRGITTLADEPITVPLSDESFCASAFDWGIREIADHALSRLGITGAVAHLHRRFTANLSSEKLVAATTALVAHRLIPRTDASERGTHAWYTEELFVPGKTPLTLMDCYRSLDFLIDHKDAIEQAYVEANRDLFAQRLDLVLFDTTSLYYWGGADHPCEETDLLQYGFSKDGKGNLKQVIVGVLMTASGVPIAHEVFPGNTADVSSFATIITTVTKKYNLNTVILVADRGMVSEENLLILEEMGLGYIVGVRMRTLPHDLQKVLLADLDPKDMEKVNDHLFTREYRVANFGEKSIKTWFLGRIMGGRRKNPLPTMDPATIERHVKHRRFFTFLNPLVAAGTRGKRAFFREVIKRKIATTPTKEWILKNGYKKYLTFEEGLHPSLDEERLEHEELFDGTWMLLTNVPELSPVEAGRYYQSLQRIERGFRDLKSLIAIRPIFHFTERRIRAHVFVCFLVLAVKWWVCRTLNPHSQEEGRRFFEDVTRLRAIAVDEPASVYIRTALTPAVKQAMEKLSMPIPKKVLLDRRSAGVPHKHAGGRPKQKAWAVQTTMLEAV